MPLQKSKNLRLKRFYRNKKKRVMNISRPLRYSAPILTVKRTCCLGTISPNVTTTNGFWQYRTVSLGEGFKDQTGASMGGLYNIGEFQALFDQYRMRAYKITLRPRAVNMVNDQTATAAFGRDQNWVSVVVDPADIVSPTGTFTFTTLNSFLETGKVKTYRGDKTVNIFVKPKVFEQYGSGANRLVKPDWTSTDATGTFAPHRGYHLFFHTNTMTSASLTPYDVFITYYLQFRGQR